MNQDKMDGSAATESTLGVDWHGGGWTAPRLFISLINDAAQQVGVSVSWLSEDWIARLELTGRVRYIHGTVFPINNAAAAHVAADKVSTYAVLSNAGIPVVPHYLVRFPSSGDMTGAADKALAGVSPPLVVKPCCEAGGLHVYRADTDEEALSLIGRLAPRYEALAICPFEAILDEYRVIVLDTAAMLFFRKELTSQTEWRHNLRLGARPVLEESPAVQSALTAIALPALQAVDGRFMSVDIIRTFGGLKVLEINSGVMLNHFAAEGLANKMAAVNIYAEAIRRCF